MTKVDDGKGKSFFNCKECEKAYKTEGGLKKHTDAKHNLCKSSFPSVVEKLNPKHLHKLIDETINKLANDQCFPSDVRSTISCLKIDHDGLLDLYEYFRPIIAGFRDPEKYFIEYYGKVSSSPVPIFIEKLGSANGTLFCHELGNHILKHLVAGVTDTIDEPVSAILASKEESVLEYICGYICHKTFTKLRFSKHFNSKYHMQSMEVLKANKSNEESSSSQRLVAI